MSEKQLFYLSVFGVIVFLLIIGFVIYRFLKKKKDPDKIRKKEEQKRLHTIDEFLEIESINEYDITLKDNTRIVGIKVLPHDLFVEKNDVAIKMINQLSSAWSSFDFPIWHSFVFTPNTFAELDNHLAEILEDETINDIRKDIAREDRKKLKYFSQNQYQLEFFLFIKEKDQKRLLEQLELLISELERPMRIEKLTRYDFLNYITDYFEVDENLLSKAYTEFEEHI